METIEEAHRKWKKEFRACDKRCKEVPDAWFTVRSPKGEIPCPFYSEKCWAAKKKPIWEEETVAKALLGCGVPRILIFGNRQTGRPPARFEVAVRLPKGRGPAKDPVFYAESWVDRGIVQGRCLFLAGEPDSAKSYSLVCALREILLRRLRKQLKFDRGSGEILYYPLSVLFDELSGMDFERGAEFKRRLKNASVLFLEDLGAEELAPWKRDLLTALFDYREGNELATACSMNKDASALPSWIGERAASRIQGTWGAILGELKTRDFRKGRKMEE